MTIQDRRALPSGPFELAHRSLQSGLRAWVERQTRLPLGYVEQLYTFADRDRPAATGARVISVSYLGLTAPGQPRPANTGGLAELVRLFPLGGSSRRRAGADRADRCAGLNAWATARRAGTPATRAARAAIAFGLDGRPWNEELVLQRYELLTRRALSRRRIATRPDVGVGTAVPGRAMVLRSPPHSRHRHRPAARQDQISIRWSSS